MGWTQKGSPISWSSDPLPPICSEPPPDLPAVSSPLLTVDLPWSRCGARLDLLWNPLMPLCWVDAAHPLFLFPSSQSPSPPWSLAFFYSLPSLISFFRAIGITVILHIYIRADWEEEVHKWYWSSSAEDLVLLWRIQEVQVQRVRFCFGEFETLGRTESRDRESGMEIEKTENLESRDRKSVV